MTNLSPTVPDLLFHLLMFQGTFRSVHIVDNAVDENSPLLECSQLASVLPVFTVIASKPYPPMTRLSDFAHSKRQLAWLPYFSGSGPARTCELPLCDVGGMNCVWISVQKKE